MQISAIKGAMEQVIINSDVNNGTQGIEFQCVLHRVQLGYDADRKSIEAKMNSAMIKRDLKTYEELEKKLSELPEVSKFFIFKLLKPMKGLKSTLERRVGNKIGILTMDVDEVWMTDFFMKAGGALADTTDKKWKDPSTGKEYDIIKVKLNKGLIDVFPPKFSTYRDTQTEIIPKRAMCTLLSLHSMQVLGRLSSRERADYTKLYGFDVKDVE